METVKEAVEVRLGRRGDPGEAGVTFNDLIDAGVVRGVGRLNPRTGNPEISPGPGSPGSGGEAPSLPPPTAPSGFTVLGVFGGIHVLWDQPGYQFQIVYTEIRRGTGPDFEASDLLGIAGGNSYFDIIPGNAEETFWYWARHVNVQGQTGPWSSAIEATKPADTGYIIERISGEIDENVLTPAFSDRLDGLETTLNEQGDRYTLTLNNEGHITGYTLYNTGEESAFVVLADTFVIANTLGVERYPFIVQNGVTYIDEAMIRDASIQEGKLGPITIGKITKNDGTPITTVGGLLRADSIDANNLSVAEAAVFTGAVSSDNFVSGQQGWYLDPITGAGEINFPIRFGAIEGGQSVVEGSKDSLSDPSFRRTVSGEATFWSSGLGGIDTYYADNATHGFSARLSSIEDEINRVWALAPFTSGVLEQRFSVTPGQTINLSATAFFDYESGLKTESSRLYIGCGFWDHDTWVGIEEEIFDYNDPDSIVVQGSTKVYTGSVVVPATATDMAIFIGVRNCRAYFSYVSFEIGESGIAQWVRPGTTLIDGNKIYTGDAYVDTLQIKGNAVTVPVHGKGNVIPDSGNSWVNNVLSVSIELDVDSDIMIWWAFDQGYFGGSGVWGFRVKVDGVTINQRSGMDARNDYPSSTERVSATAGNHTISLDWRGGGLEAVPMLVIMGAQR